MRTFSPLEQSKKKNDRWHSIRRLLWQLNRFFSFHFSPYDCLGVLKSAIMPISFKLHAITTIWMAMAYCGCAGRRIETKKKSNANGETKNAINKTTPFEIFDTKNFDLTTTSGFRAGKININLKLSGHWTTGKDTFKVFQVFLMDKICH